MSTLHTVNKSAYERNALQELPRPRPGWRRHSPDRGWRVTPRARAARIAPAADRRQGGCKIYALGPDLAARGIVAGEVLEGIETVDYAGFVDLAAGATRVCAWL